VCVRVDEVLLTTEPRAEHRWDVYWGGTATVTLPSYPPEVFEPVPKLLPACICNQLSQAMAAHYNLESASLQLQAGRQDSLAHGISQLAR